MLRGAFNKDGITEYIRDMAGGRGRTTKFRGESLPPVGTIEAWDGKDGEVSVNNPVTYTFWSWDLHCSFDAAACG